VSRILIWSPNYAPELIGIPPLVTDAAEWLVERGHQVDVVTAFPNYPERLIRPEYRQRFYTSSLEGGVAVHRSWLRVRPRESFLDKALYEWSFALISLPRVVRFSRRADAVVCVVPSLAAAAVAARLVRPQRLVLWVQDLVAAAAGAIWRGPRVVRRLMRTLERSAFLHADRLIVCSPGFRDYAAALGTDRARIETVYNWVDAEEIQALPPAERDRTRFLYSGNLGYTQGFETLVEGAQIAGDTVELDIVGSGNAAADVAVLAGRNVTVRPPVARSDYPALLADTDVHVVVQRRMSAGVNLPSKIASYLASGRPILASIDAATPAAELLRASGAALIVEPEDAAAVAAAMRHLHEAPDLRAELGRRGREFAVARLERAHALARFEAIVLG
jgi:colanic acid biosynthesis glycosyl transferase WcaI